MTAREALSELKVIKNVYAGMRKEYKPCVEALNIAINALEKEAWKEEHPVSPLHKSVKEELCTYCAVRMSCESYLDWLKDSWRIAPPRVKGCEKFINDSN